MRVLTFGIFMFATGLKLIVYGDKISAISAFVSLLDAGTVLVVHWCLCVLLATRRSPT
jgi:hypothetical protein